MTLLVNRYTVHAPSVVCHVVPLIVENPQSHFRTVLHSSFATYLENALREEHCYYFPAESFFAAKNKEEHLRLDT